MDELTVPGPDRRLVRFDLVVLGGGEGEAAGVDFVRHGETRHANMAGNLARQPEMPAALDLLERSHRLHRGGAHGLQRGLQPAEQRVADGLPPATLQHAWRRPRIVARVAELAGRLRRLAREHQAALDALGRFVPAVREATTQAVGAAVPTLQQSHAQPHVRVQRRHGPQNDQGYAAGRSRGSGRGM